MCNISYEDYMRNVLGYIPNNNTCMQDTYQTNDYYVMPTNIPCGMAPCENNNQLERMYPEVYHKIYPLICKECRLNTMPLTKEAIERMTDSVCNAMELDLKVETTVKVEIRNDDVRNPNVRQSDTRETRQNNNALRDLIKILILRELLGGGFPNRPPFPPRPPMPGPGPRPPFPGGPGRPPFPGGHGPIMPR